MNLQDRILARVSLRHREFLEDFAKASADEARLFYAEVVRQDRRVESQNIRMRTALQRLAEWDMLTLTPDGHGAVTADAPWARKLIAEALE